MIGSETERLQALADYAILDTDPEDAFDRLTALAADLFDAPIALVSLVDAERQWFKARHGIDARSTPRSWAFCHYALELEKGEALIVEDATVDPRFMANPLVTHDPNIRFYTGAVLTGRGGHNLGTLCVIDTKARPTPSPDDLRRLKILAQLVVDELELRRLTRLARERGDLLAMAEAVAGLGHWRLDARSRQIVLSEQMYRIWGLDPDAALGPDALLSMTYPGDLKAQNARIERQLQTGATAQFVSRVMLATGEARYLACNSAVERGDGGVVTALIGTVMDVTEQRLTEMALAGERELLEVTLHSIGDGVVTTDEAGCIRYMNPAAEAMLGWRNAQAEGIAFEAVVQLLDQGSCAEIDDPIGEAQGNGGSVREALLRTRFAADRPIQYSASPIRGRQGATRGAVVVLQDLSEVRALAQRMSHLAQHDALTGLPNRSLFYDRARLACQSIPRSRSGFAVAYLDLDGFKQVNDTLGHAAGDDLLKTIANRLTGALRANDTVCRLGGDEFVLLLEDITSDEAAGRIARELIAHVARPCRLGETEVAVSASIGVALFRSDGADADSLMRNADRAMYAAKRAGKNRYQLFSELEPETPAPSRRSTG